MTDNQNPFADFDLERAIALRWTLRDIKGKRLKLSPVSESDLSTLTNLGWSKCATMCLCLHRPVMTRWIDGTIFLERVT
jgi:hypothetical protein